MTENEFSFIFSKMNWQLIVYESQASWRELFKIFSFFDNMVTASKMSKYGVFSGPYFRISHLDSKVPSSEKNINTNQKFYGLEIRLNPFIYRYPETKIFHFSKRTRWSKVSNAFWESTNVMLVCICLSIPIKTKSFKWARQINVCWIVCWVMHVD